LIWPSEFRFLKQLKIKRSQPSPAPTMCEMFAPLALAGVA
jgi:hypothetical protein